MDVTRCEWAEGSSAAMLAYHDEEWGVPSHDERHLFELLILEGAQAGLSWSTILNKRAGYRRGCGRLFSNPLPPTHQQNPSAALGRPPTLPPPPPLPAPLTT